ncbi:MAG: methyltransferase domain-containing protein [bacterium]
MSGKTGGRNSQMAAGTKLLPRMVGAADLSLVSRHAAALDAEDVVVEFGPWLGAVSEVLARKAHLVVVDNFVWTKDHDRRAPGLVSPGVSFRASFEANMRTQRLKVEVHETDFSDFAWDGRPVRMIYVDAPKSAPALAAILSKVWAALTSDAVIIVKNALHPSYPDMADFLQRLVNRKVLVRADVQGDAGCNSLALGRGPAACSEAEMVAEAEQVASEVAEVAAASSAVLAAIAGALAAADFARAYQHLDRLAPDAAHLRPYEEIERGLARNAPDPEALALFSEIFALHNDRPSVAHSTTGFQRSIQHCSRAFWIRNAGKPWRGRSMHPEILEQAIDYGYMGWPSRIQDWVRAKDVLDVGCGPGLHGLGYLTGGANSYLGLDPIVKLDQDRVKNLTGKRKEGFGWTPRELMQKFPAWKVSPKLTSDLPRERAFDVATLHNVTEHLLHLDAVFRDLSELLRPGGIMVYNHHNFFTWNGHHMPPKTVADIDPSDDAQLDFVDWAHLDYQPAVGHYLQRGLNRMRLDDVIETTRRYFDIDEMEEVPARPENGASRLTDAIRARHPELAERDFLTQNLFVVARVRI